jgi:hypothetical protein
MIRFENGVHSLPGRELRGKGKFDADFARSRADSFLRPPGALGSGGCAGRLQLSPHRRPNGKPARRLDFATSTRTALGRALLGRGELSTASNF